MRMTTEGMLLRRARLERGWSQEGLCRGVCTVSYLSKIERGSAVAAPELLRQLFARMDIDWHNAPEDVQCLRETVEAAYDALFSHRMTQFVALAKTLDAQKCSPFAPDAMLLTAFAASERKPLAAELEPCLDTRQLSLQRALQGRFSEAVALYPRAYFYYMAGNDAYWRGENYSAALGLLQTGYELAAQEGAAHLMLLCRTTAGSCYCNLLDVPNMLAQYAVAERLCKALNDTELLETIHYNIASARLETGDFATAYAYFSAVSEPSVMTLHKLAICCEKLGRQEEALEALDRADAMQSEYPDTQTARRLCGLVRMRLEAPDYLHNEAYGKMLLRCFDDCRSRLPVGYASFHLPWVLEWYTASRQYKQAYELMRDFPYLIPKS